MLADSLSELSRYIKFMKKDIRAKQVALPKSVRSNYDVLLSQLHESDVVQFDPHKFNLVEVGAQDRLVNLLVETEKHICFKNEALLRTYPTKYFLKRYRSFCENTLPKELAKLTFGQLYGTDEDVKVIDDVILSDEDQEVSPQVRIALPTYAEDEVERRRLRSDVIKMALACGYYFSSELPYDYEFNGKDIRVFYMTFEAKYTCLDVNFNGNLYHVTSLKSLQKIKRHGLAPKMQSYIFDYPDRVFLFNDVPYETILAYGRDKALSKGDDAFCVLKILKDKLVNCIQFKNGQMKFYRDPSFSDEDSASTQQKAIFTYANIPKELIEDDVFVYNIDDGSTRMVKFM